MSLLGLCTTLPYIYFYLVLDLSFNNIEVIEGLDKLTKLKDLTLYNNRISKIENMEALSQLHVFSIGNNSLKQLDNVSTKYYCYYYSSLGGGCGQLGFFGRLVPSTAHAVLPNGNPEKHIILHTYFSF